MIAYQNLRLLAQLVNTIESASVILEKSIVEKDLENTKKAKNEILKLQKDINSLLKE